MKNSTSSTKSKKKIVLVIEDNTSVQSVYKDLLSQAGYEVAVASTVDQACSALGKDSPDLIVLDIMLAGGKNGFDFLEIAKKQNLLKGTPVVVLSNLDKDDNLSQDMGVVEWLVKANISTKEVVEKINKILK